MKLTCQSKRHRTWGSPWCWRRRPTSWSPITKIVLFQTKFRNVFFGFFFNDDRLSLKSLFVTFIGSFFRLSVSSPLPLPASKIIFFWSLKKNIFNPKFIFKMSPNTMEGPAPSHGRRSWRRAWPALACCMFNTKSPTDGPATFNRTIHAKHTRARFICTRTLLWWKKTGF